MFEWALHHVGGAHTHGAISALTGSASARCRPHREGARRTALPPGPQTELRGGGSKDGACLQGHRNRRARPHLVHGRRPASRTPRLARPPRHVGRSDRCVCWQSRRSHHLVYGYGVYYEPVARAARKAGATVIASGSGLYGTAIAPAEVYRAILQGHPVLAWISNTYHAVPLAKYVAYDGATVRYTLTEHAVTLIGVRPDAVLINH